MNGRKLEGLRGLGTNLPFLTTGAPRRKSLKLVEAHHVPEVLDGDHKVPRDEEAELRDSTQDGEASLRVKDEG